MNNSNIEINKIILQKAIYKFITTYKGQVSMLNCIIEVLQDKFNFKTTNNNCGLESQIFGMGISAYAEYLFTKLEINKNDTSELK